jgi:hypothetical protein
VRSIQIWLGILLLFPVMVSAQVLTSSPHTGIVQVPIGDEVYAYLRHLSVRGLITDYSEASLPVTEYDVVRWLSSIDVLKLSQAEAELRAKFLQTYRREPYQAVTMFPAQQAEPFFFTGIPTDYDKYLYRWKSDSTISDFQVHGVGSLEYRKRSKPTEGSAVLGVIGGRFTGTLSGHVGFFMETTNGQDFGDSSIALEDPIIGKNKNFAAFSNHNFFDQTTAELSYTMDWFTAKIAREAISIGGSYQGSNVIISSTVQTPDFISLQAHVGAVKYQAIVASLLGDARFSAGQDSTASDFGAGAYIDQKYITIHDLTFGLGNAVELGFTDMTIFSRRFDLAYVNPFSFLKSVEHSLNDRDNGLLALHARWRIADGLEVRGQGLCDDISASKIGTGFWGNKFAWQIGSMWSAPFGLNDIDVAFEHTRVEPFTYSHFNTQNAFTTSRQLLGAGIGPNSLSYWAMIRWAASAKLTLEATITLIERGENIYNDTTGALMVNVGADYEQSIRAGDQEKFSILDGRRVNITTVQATARYELWRGLTFLVQFLNRSVDYLAGTPVNPMEKPYGLLTIGAKALF